MRLSLFFSVKFLCLVTYLMGWTHLKASDELQESTEITATTLTYSSEGGGEGIDDLQAKDPQSVRFFNSVGDIQAMLELIVETDHNLLKAMFNAIPAVYLHDFCWQVLRTHQKKAQEAIAPLWGGQGILFRMSGDGTGLPQSYLDQHDKHQVMELLKKNQWGAADIDMGSRVIWTVYYDFNEWQQKKCKFMDTIDSGERESLSELGIQGTIDSIVNYRQFLTKLHSFFQAMYFLVSHRLPEKDRQDLNYWMTHIDDSYKSLYKRMRKFQETSVPVQDGEGEGKEHSPKSARKNSKNSPTPSLKHRLKEKFSHHGDERTDSAVLKRRTTSPEFKPKELPKGSTSPKSLERKHHKK